jgi:hypothetical protein
MGISRWAQEQRIKGCREDKRREGAKEGKYKGREETKRRERKREKGGQYRKKRGLIR